MSGQSIVVALMVIGSFLYLTLTLIPAAWKGTLAARLSKRGRRPGTSSWLRRLLDFAARRMARGAGCAGCASGGSGGDRLRALLAERR